MDDLPATVQDRKLAVALAAVEGRRGHAIAGEYRAGSAVRMVCRCGWVGPTRSLSPLGACWLERTLLADASGHAGVGYALWTEAMR